MHSKHFYPLNRLLIPHVISLFKSLLLIVAEKNYITYFSKLIQNDPCLMHSIETTNLFL